MFLTLFVFSYMKGVSVVRLAQERTRLRVASNPHTARPFSPSLFQQVGPVKGAYFCTFKCFMPGQTPLHF